MAVRERVMISRLIEKIELQSDYASKIGLSCQLATTRAKALNLAAAAFNRAAVFICRAGHARPLQLSPRS